MGRTSEPKLELRYNLDMKKAIAIILGIILFVVVTSIFIYPFLHDLLIAFNENSDRDQQLIREAVAKEDYTICRKVADGYIMSSSRPRVDCYKQVVEKTANKDLCKIKEVTNSFDSGECYTLVSSITKDQALCDLIESEFSGNCYSNIAREKSDPTICELITHQRQLWVQGDCYGYFVTKNKNPSVCSTVNDSFTKEICYTSYITINTKPEFCENTFPTSRYKNGCYLSLARRTKNSKLCEKMVGENAATNKADCIVQTTDEYQYTD